MFSHNYSLNASYIKGSFCCHCYDGFQEYSLFSGEIISERPFS